MIKHLAPFFFLLLLLAMPAQAEDYTKPDWTNLVRTLIRFGALNIKDDAVMDEYAAITECDLYKSVYRDDFKWNTVRGAMRDSIAMNLPTFPTSYKYQTLLQLDRYDFQNKLFRLTAKTQLRNVNSFLIYKVQGAPCDGKMISLIPSSFHAAIDVPIYFDGIPLVQKDAEALLQTMKDDKNDDQIIVAQFNFRIVYIDPLHPSHLNDDKKSYAQANSPELHSVRLDARLDSIDFYEDQAMTKLIYRLQP